MPTLTMRCATPAERAEVARRLRSHVAALGLEARVEPVARFKIAITAEQRVIDLLFVASNGAQGTVRA